MQGIYKIIYVKTGKMYVGSSTDIEYRWKQHIHFLKAKKHHSPGLQNVVNKYGIEVLKFEILEEVKDKELLIEREQYWIDTLNTYNKGFNSIKYINSRPIFSKKLKKKISIATKAGMNKYEIKEKMRLAKLGSKSPKAKLNEQQVEEIKILLSKELFNRRILSLKYNVSIDTIDDIISGNTWSHIRSDLTCLINKTNKLKKEEILLIKKLVNSKKVSQKVIAKMFKICQQTVSDIKTGKIWSKI